MKKKSLILTVVTVLAAISLSACVSSPERQTDNERSSSTPSSAVVSSYTPSSTVVSSYTPSSTVESSSYSRVESSEAKSNWELRYFVDDFGEPTNDAYIMCIGEGSFSNSATNKSDLLYAILYDKSKNEDSRFQIKLFEYGSYPVNNTYSSGRYYTIKVKCGSSTATKEGFMNSDNGDRIFVDSSNDIVECLKNGNDVTFSITQDDRPSTNYLFKVKADGFSKAYNQL